MHAGKLSSIKAGVTLGLMLLMGVLSPLKAQEPPRAISPSAMQSGGLVELVAVPSADAVTEPIGYTWVQHSGPQVELFTYNRHRHVSFFVAPIVTETTTMEFELQAQDPQGTIASSRLTLVIPPVNSGQGAPRANGGADISVVSGESFVLEGIGSSPNNSPVWMSWVQLSDTPSGAALDFGNMEWDTHQVQLTAPSVTSPRTERLLLLVTDGHGMSAVDVVQVTVLPPATLNREPSFANDFEQARDGLAGLFQYDSANPTGIPSSAASNNGVSVVQQGGRYRAEITADDHQSLFFNNSQGRLDGIRVSFPFEVIARNVGIGTLTDSQAAPNPTGVMLAGIQVHHSDFSSRNYAHLVVGHGVTNRQYTVEAKNTRNGSSAYDYEDNGSAPQGRADLRLVGHADGTLSAYWQVPAMGGSDQWIAYEGHLGNGPGRLPGAAPEFGEEVIIGLLTYAYGPVNGGFVGTADAFTVTSGGPVTTASLTGTAQATAAPVVAVPVNTVNPLSAILSGPTLELSSLSFAEGPLWNPADQSLFFTEISADRVMQYFPQTRQLNQVKAGQGHFSNGLAQDAGGNRVEAQHATQRVVRYVQGNATVVADNYNGVRFNSPNDLVIHPNGTVFFTDPTFGSMGNLGGASPQPLGFRGIYRVATDGRVTLVGTGNQPNGIGLTPDNANLLVTDYSSGTLTSYPLNASAEVSGAGRVLATGVASGDGFCQDTAGNIYIASGGNLRILSAAGTLYGTVTIPGTATNCAFGGSDRRTIYVTTRTGLYSLTTTMTGYR